MATRSRSGLAWRLKYQTYRLIRDVRFVRLVEKGVAASCYVLGKFSPRRRHWLVQNLPLATTPLIVNVAVLLAIAGKTTEALTLLKKAKKLGSHRRFESVALALLETARDRRALDAITVFLEGAEVNGVTPFVRSVAIRKVIAATQTSTPTAPIRSCALLNPDTFSAFMDEFERAGGTMDRLAPLYRNYLRGFQVARLSPAAPHRKAEKPRILVVSLNWNFLQPVMEALSAAGYQVRSLDFSIVQKALAKQDSSPLKQLLHQAEGDEKFEPYDELREITPIAHDLLEWADIVFADWWNQPAIWLSRFLPDDKKLIIRCHSYEVFTENIYWTNLKRVDAMVFIAPHILQAAKSIIGTEFLGDLTTVVIPNLRSPKQLPFIQRHESARFTLGMTQYANSNKDPLLALDILERLRERDPRWRLRFAGRPWKDNLSDEVETAYRDRFRERVAALKDAVFEDGFQNDMGAWYSKIGFILSLSHREGSHESLVEGMLTGALPVLRRWPMMARFGAPECLYPGIPVFDDIDAAVDMILSAQAAYDDRSAKAHAYADRHCQSEMSAKPLFSLIEDVAEGKIVAGVPA